MSYSKTARLTVCSAALALSANAAFADVKANDVWEQWQDQFMMYGDGITVGEVTESGDTLTVTSISIDATDDKGISTLKGEFGPLILTSQDDGTVDVAMPSLLEFSVVENGHAESTVNFIVSITGQKMTASGIPGEINYDFAADKYGVTLGQQKLSDEDVSVAVDMAINNVSGTYLQKGTQTMGVSTTSSIEAGLLTYLVGFEDMGERFDLSGQITGISMTSSNDLPANYNALSSDFGQLKALRSSLELNSQAAIAHVDFDSAADGAGQVTLTSNGGTLGFELADGSFSYDDLYNDFSLQIIAPEMPFPIAVTADQLGFGITMPLAQSETTQPFGLSTGIVGLNVDETIWALLDPTSSLPHDPVTLSYNLEGTGRLLIDLGDEEAMNGAFDAGQSPFELQTLSLTSFLFSAVGAEVKAAGDFTFDNNDLVTFDGFPAPEGRIDLLAIGVNGLLDKVAAMPLGLSEQIMGARMMLGMFTTVTGEDELTSTIEVQKTGAISVNGQRMR